MMMKMRNWEKAFTMVFCLLMMLAVAGCGSKEKFTGSNWVSVHKGTTGIDNDVTIYTFEKNGKSFTCTKKTTDYIVRPVDDKVEKTEDEPSKEVGLVYDEKSNSLTIMGAPRYTYMSKDDTIVEQGNPQPLKKMSKEEIEKAKKDVQEHAQKLADKRKEESKRYFNRLF
ncbi:hypothetical protein SAMN02910455_02093 [Acidaminococcus fermentans]|uniref:hypothetical protein n=1 Tax=Acidaminococcus fermentans TaxID=905 RepID=UPI0008E98DA9|nr:hypothetical protein [Acidaminococcus fermentans]SFO79843.1 hypothetical protein SAMN02910455_02093 [Acidaminococcus fermentans]